MSMTLYDATVQNFIQAVGAVTGFLDKKPAAPAAPAATQPVVMGVIDIQLILSSAKAAKGVKAALEKQKLDQHLQSLSDLEKQISVFKV